MSEIWRFMQDHSFEAAIAAIVIGLLNIAFIAGRRP